MTEHPFEDESEWVVAHLTETKGIPFSAEVQRAFVDNSVDAATAKLLDISSLEEIGITSSLIRARVLAALQLDEFGSTSPL